MKFVYSLQLCLIELEPVTDEANTGVLDDQLCDVGIEGDWEGLKAGVGTGNF